MVRGKILRQWSTIPKRVVLTADGSSVLRVIAPSDSWKSVTVESSHGIVVSGVGVGVDSSQNEIRDFNVRLSSEGIDKTKSLFVRLRHQGESVPFLSVPVLIEDAVARN